MINYPEIFAFMKFSINKPKTYKGLSYPLKSSFLKQAMEEAELDIEVNLHYWTPQILGSILSVDYWLPNEHISGDRFFIRAGAIPSQSRKAAEG